MPLTAETSRPAAVESRRIELADGLAATVHVARYARESTCVLVRQLLPAAPLDVWAEANGVDDALSAGYMVQAEGFPLGLLRIDGETREHRAFREPWDVLRSCVHADDEACWIGPPGSAESAHVVQAGPLLVLAGAPCDLEDDPGGFASTCDELGRDVTAGRAARAAFGLSEDELIAVVADGGGGEDAGLTLTELANVLVEVGARDAVNLAGGSAGALLAEGRLISAPRDDDGSAMEHPSPTVSALVFMPRV